jgi:hypothetical protein
MQGENEMTTVSISGDLLNHVRKCLQLSFDYIRTGAGVRHDTNAFTPHAFPAYVCAVAAVEAFVNERLLGPLARAALRGSPLWNLGSDSIEKMELLTKLVVVPQVLFGRCFPRDAQPFQDFAMLVKVRNDVIHFKMEMNPPSYLRPLAEKGVALTADAAAQGADYPWPSKLSSTQGIRWAYNTACRVLTELAHFVPPEHQYVLGMSAGCLREISEVEMRAWVAEVSGE